MNKPEKEVRAYYDKTEKQILKTLEKEYKEALAEVNQRIAGLLGLQNPNLPNIINHLEYQRKLKGWIQSALDKLHSKEYESISEYLDDSYLNGFTGAMYALHHQDIPLLLPVDENVMVKAVTLDTQLKEDLYTSLGKDLNTLRKTIQSEMTRGIATGLLYKDIARNIANVSGIPLRRAKTIARTEAGRIQEQATMDAAYKAKDKGADVVKQWSSKRDGKTRLNHRILDGQIRELNEPFTIGTKKAMAPHGFGDAAEDCNCRCTTLIRARDALDEDELERLQENASKHGLLVKDSKAYGRAKAKDFADFRKKYLIASRQENLRGSLPSDFTDTRKIGEPIKQHDLNKFIEKAKLLGVQIGKDSNDTGGFENYCGDLSVLNDVVEQAAKQVNSAMFKKSRGKKIILMYDNIMDDTKAGQIIDIGTFATTRGQTVVLNKFMYDDSGYLAKEYANAVATGHFPKGTDYTCVVAHEAGHIIDKNTRGLRNRVVSIIEKEAQRQNVTLEKYIRENVSGYGTVRNFRWELRELIPELNSMLNSGKKYDIIELLRKEGVYP